jgi:hypothetical protein
MKINCLSCGHNIDLDEAYGDHYEGEIKCFGCGATLELCTEHNAIRYVRLRGIATNNQHGDAPLTNSRDADDKEA